MPKSKLPLNSFDQRQRSFFAEFQDDLRWDLNGALKSLKKELKVSDDGACHFWILRQDKETENCYEMEVPIGTTSKKIVENNWIIIYSLEKGQRDNCRLCQNLIDQPGHRLSKKQRKLAKDNASGSYTSNAETPLTDLGSEGDSVASDLQELTVSPENQSLAIPTIDTSEISSRNSAANIADPDAVGTDAESLTGIDAPQLNLDHREAPTSIVDIETQKDPVDQLEFVNTSGDVVTCLNSIVTAIISTNKTLDANYKEIKSEIKKNGEAVEKLGKRIDSIEINVKNAHEDLSVNSEFVAKHAVVTDLRANYANDPVLSTSMRKRFPLSEDLFSDDYKYLLKLLPRAPKSKENKKENKKWTRDDPCVSNLNGKTEADLVVKLRYLRGQESSNRVPIKQFRSPPQSRASSTATSPVDEHAESSVKHFGTCCVVEVTRDMIAPSAPFSKFDNYGWKKFLLKMMQLERSIIGANSYYKAVDGSGTGKAVGWAFLVSQSFGSHSVDEKKEMLKTLFQCPEVEKGLKNLKELYDNNSFRLLY